MYISIYMYINIYIYIYITGSVGTVSMAEAGAAIRRNLGSLGEQTGPQMPLSGPWIGEGKRPVPW